MVRRGRVLFFNKTYGFIKDENSREYYFHFSQIKSNSDSDYKNINKGQLVSFSLNEQNKITSVTAIDEIINGKKIVLVAYCEVTNIISFKINIGCKEEYGLYYLYIYENKLIASNNEAIKDIINAKNLDWLHKGGILESDEYYFKVI